MASTGKASKQIKQIRSSHAVANHRFFNMIIQGVIKRMEESVPGLKIEQSAASVTKTGGTQVLMGRITVKDQEEYETVDAKVRQTFDSLRNPADLLSTIQ